MLLSRHDTDDTICVSAYGMKGGKPVVRERFCNGVDEAADLIARSYENPSIGAIWTNIQRLKRGSHARRKENIEAYTNILVDIDRKWKMIHEDGSLCQHANNKECKAFKANATDAEISMLRAEAEKINGFLNKLGDGVFAFSGNGFHLSRRIVDSPYVGPRRPGHHYNPLEPKEGADLYKRLLALLRAKFQKPDLNMEIDVSLSDETQAVTVWGTWNRKYPDLLERPQRQSEMLYMPSQTADPLRKLDLEIFLLENDPDGEETPETMQISPKAGNDDVSVANPEWQENYGVPHLVEFYDGLIAYESDSYESNGNTHHPVTPCACHEDEDLHEHSNKRHCEIIEFSDGTIGISCFSGSITNLKQVIKKLNELKGENYPHAVFAKSAAEIAAEEAENAAALAALGVQQAPLPKARPEKPSVETEEPEEQESTLRYPELIPDFETICYPGSKLRDLVYKACEGGDLTGNRAFALSPGFIIPAILTLISAIPDEDEMLGARINLYTCLLAMSRAGKDVSWTRSGSVLGLGKRGESEYWRDYDPGGHSQMVEELGDTQERKSKENPKPAVIPGPKKACGISAELSSVLKSARGESSHMLETFQKFFDSNLHRTRERNTHRKVTMNCRFSWGTSLAIGVDKVEEKRFTKVFGDQVNDGFASRFLYGFSETAVNPKDLEEWHGSTDKMYDVETGNLEEALTFRTYPEQIEKHVVDGYEDGVRELYVATEVNYFPGAAFLFKKAMVVIACANLHRKVTMKDFKAALAFIQWQAAIRDVFKPSQADDSAQARFNELVRRAVRRADGQLAKKGTDAKKRWVNVQRLAQRNEWSLNNTVLGLERTVRALQAYGDLILSEPSDDGDVDWRKVRAAHSKGKCWCKERHDQAVG